jgi:membrane associated rhomboid family serine protease
MTISPMNDRTSRPRITKTTLVIVGLMALLVVVRAVLPNELDRSLVYYLGSALFPYGTLQPERAYTLITSIFLHVNWIHALFNSMWILFLGSLAQPHLGSLRFVLFFLLCGVGGGMFAAGLNWGEPGFGIGASGAAFGLLGGGAFFLVDTSKESTFGKVRKLVIYAAVMMLVLNFAYAFSGFASMIGVPGRVSWEAHLGGFLTGMVLFPLLQRRVRA